MGLFSFLFETHDESDDYDQDDDDRHDVFTSLFGNPGDTSEDEDLASGNYKEKHWYD